MERKFTDADLHQMSFNMVGSDFLFIRLKRWAIAKKIYQKHSEEPIAASGRILSRH